MTEVSGLFWDSIGTHIRDRQEEGGREGGKERGRGREGGRQ